MKHIPNTLRYIVMLYFKRGFPLFVSIALMCKDCGQMQKEKKGVGLDLVEQRHDTREIDPAVPVQVKRSNWFPGISQIIRVNRSPAIPA